MPYSITTQDGITIDNIPDSIRPDAPELKSRVAEIRANAGKASAQPGLDPRLQQLTPPGANITPTARAPEPSLGEKILGAGEAGLTLGSSMLLAPVGMALGTGAGAIEAALNGTYGTTEGANAIEARAKQAAQSAVYQPRTSAGQGYVQSAGETLAPLQALGPGNLVGVPMQAAQTAQYVKALAQTGAAKALPASARSAAAVAPTPTKTVLQAPIISPIAQAVPSAAKPSAQAAAKPAVTSESAGAIDVLTLARKAESGGPGSASAKAKLAEMAQVNPEAKAAANRLGVDLPFDVFSDNPQVRAAVGLTRAKVAGEAEAAWESAVRNFTQKADELSQASDAAFIEGRPAPGMTSQKILDNLKATQGQMDEQARAMYARVDEAVPKTSPVQFPKLAQTLDEILKEVGETGFTTQERKLYELATDPTATYGRLLREKDLIGKAMAGKDSPYGNMAAGSLKRLYGALAEDQLTNVGTIGGEALRTELRAANFLTGKKKGLEQRIVGAFGRDVDGSVAQKMLTAVTTASKGDAASFNKLMKVVPPELQKETIATALASITSSKAAGRSVGASEVVFSPNEFTKVYRGLRANGPVYSQMAKIMGPEWEQTTRDLYTLSKRIADAQARIPTTGKANQILGEAAIDGLMSKVMGSGLTQRAATGAASIVPGAGVLAPDIVQWMSSAKGSGVQKASKLFASPEFQEMAVQAATNAGKPSEAAIRRVAFSPAFSAFAKSIRIPNKMPARIEWLRGALQNASVAANQQQEATAPQP